MKKRIILLGFSLFFVFFIVDKVHAQPGGLLQGKPFVYKGSPNYVVTDGDPNTYVMVSAFESFSYESAIAMDIDSYYFDWGPGNATRAEVQFYDSAGKLLYVGPVNSRFQQKVFLDNPIKNVTKIKLYNATYENYREFDVWGSLDLERPVSVVVTPGVKKISVNFGAPVGATGYYVYLNGVKFDHFVGTSYVIKNLEPYKPYTVQLSAEYNGIESKLTDAKTVYPYADPVIPIIQADADWNKITVTWNKEEANATKYSVFLNGKRITETESMPYVINSLSPETSYELQIKYTDKNNRDLESEVVTVKTKVKPKDTVPPDRPRLLSAALSTDYTSIALSWVANTEDDLAGYNLYVSDNGGDSKKLNSSLLSATKYSFLDVVMDHVYEFRLEAVDLSGNVSEPISTSIKAARPVTESDQENKDDYILVTWKPTSGAVGYLIYLNGKQVGTAGPDDTSFKITKAMGYNPSALSNATLVKAKFADGSTGEGSNTNPPVIGNPDGWGLTGSDIWKNIVLLVASLGLFILLGICIRLAPKVFRVLRQAINWRG